MSEKSAAPKEGLRRLLLTLFVITLLSGSILGTTYALTQGVIAQGKAQRLQQNLLSLLGSFDNSPTAESFQLEAYPDLVFYPAKSAGALSALAVESTSNKGYAGKVSLLAGFKPNGDLLDVVVQQQRETPGLGSKMKEPKFLDQFRDTPAVMFPLRVKKDGGQVDAITAATISSRAFLDALNKAQVGAQAFLKQNEANKETEP